MRELGCHLVADFLSPKIEKLGDVRYIYDFLEDVTLKLDMVLVSPPIVFRFPCCSADYVKLAEKYPEFTDLLEKRKNDFGVSGVGVWSTSHVSVHTYKEIGAVSFDAYSCGYFDKDVLISVIKEWFTPESGHGVYFLRVPSSPYRFERFVFT